MVQQSDKQDVAESYPTRVLRRPQDKLKVSLRLERRLLNQYKIVESCQTTEKCSQFDERWAVADLHHISCGYVWDKLQNETISE
jgi:hypothetical protein